MNRFGSRRPARWTRAGLLAAGAVIAGAVAGLDRMVVTLPNVAPLLQVEESEGGSRIYDANGHIVANLDPARQRFTPLSRIAPMLPDAVVAVEDRHFYHNPGFDWLSIGRAALVDLIRRAPVEGASTITEQVAKNVYLDDHKSLHRKIKEFLIGLELHRYYSKRQILALYLNTVYFGQGAFGVGAAARAYFDTTPAKLTAAEATMLAGLPQAPSAYDPLLHPRLAKDRQRAVIGAMVRAGLLTPAAGRRIYDTPIRYRPASLPALPGSYPDPWYVDAVVAELRAHGFSMRQILDGDLDIHTALRPEVYRLAQSAVDQWMTTNFGPPRRRYPDHQAAAVVMNPHNGHVWAIIGGRRHFTFLQADLATDAVRSTGSAIKPLLDYAPALAGGYTQFSVLQDVPLYRSASGDAWWPSNDDGQYRGYIDLRDALAISDNDAAVHLVRRLGLTRALAFLARRFHVQPAPSEPRTLALALGIDTNLLRMTQAYAAIDNGGLGQQPVFVTRVTSGSRLVYQATPHPWRALTPGQAYLLTTMMQRVLDPRPLPGIGPHAVATGHALGIGRPAAAKSGTNNNDADAWFIGYEPNMAVGVWEGDRVGEVPQLYTISGRGPAYGATAAGPIWHQIMTRVNTALALKPVSFPRPPGLVYVRRVSITSGLLAGPATPARDIAGGWFVQGTRPDRRDTSWHYALVPVANPDVRWRPGCGPYLERPVLRPEPDWRPGLPKPADAEEWPPDRTCRPAGRGRPLPKS